MLIHVIVLLSLLAVSSQTSRYRIQLKLARNSAVWHILEQHVVRIVPDLAVDQLFGGRTTTVFSIVEFLPMISIQNSCRAMSPPSNVSGIIQLQKCKERYPSSSETL